MRSYPNMVPLSAPAIARIGAMLEPFQFDAIYGAWFDRSVVCNAKEAVKRSITRYVAAIPKETEQRSSNDRLRCTAPSQASLLLSRRSLPLKRYPCVPL
jgi:hypothetical protein